MCSCIVGCLLRKATSSRLETPRLIVVETTVKEKRECWNNKGKQQMPDEKPHGATVDLSAETLQARKEWHDIFKGNEKGYLKR